MREAELRLEQLKSQRAQSLAQITSSQRRVAQAQAGLTRVADILAKHDVVSPLDGIVTNLPVRLGETVVPGIQNSAASAVMTIADMSLITAEVKVDETDIVNLQIGQKADGDHRRGSRPHVYRARDRDRQYGHSAIHRTGGFQQRDVFHRGQGLQGRRGAR